MLRAVIFWRSYIGKFTYFHLFWYKKTKCKSFIARETMRHRWSKIFPKVFWFSKRKQTRKQMALTARACKIIIWRPKVVAREKYKYLSKVNFRKVANSQLNRQAMPQILISVPESESRQLVDSDSDSDSGLVTTTPGDSDSGSDSATLL